MRILSIIQWFNIFKYNNSTNDDDEFIDDEEDNNSDKEYIAGMSYSLLRDGSVDIRFMYNPNNIINQENTAGIIGELLFHIHNGTYSTQSAQSLTNFGSSIEHYTFVNQIMAAWARLEIQIKDSPIIKPSEVSKLNTPFQQQMPEEM